MRIGIDFRPLQTAHRGAGIGTYTYHLARNLLSLDRMNEWVGFILKDRPVGDMTFPRTCALRRPRTQKHVAFWDQILLPLDMIRSGVDLFHNTGGLTQVWEICVPFIQPCRTVVTVQDLHPLILPQFRFIADARAFRWQLKGLGKAAGLIAVSQNTKKDILRFVDVPEERIRVIPMAPGDHFRIQEPDAVQSVLERYRISSPYALYVGNYNVHKNIEALIEAWSHLPSSVHLVIVGRSESYPDSLKERIARVGVDRAHFTGGLPHDSPDLVALYNGATVFVFPSLYEGFGLPVVEAMRCGCPVIAAQRGSLPEVTGDAGVLVEPDDIPEMTRAIERIFDDSRWREELRQRGFGRAEQFSWESTALKTLEFYQQVA